MLSKIKERRKWKSINTDEGKKNYRRLNNELRRETEKARSIWWQDICSRIDHLQKKGQIDLMYSEIRRVTEVKKSNDQNYTINNADGEPLNDMQAIRNRWKSYIEELYNKSGKPTNNEFIIEKEDELDKDNIGPEIIDREIEEAINHMKCRKAEGIDNIPAEFLKNLGIQATKKLNELCKEIYTSGEWPEDFYKTTMIPLKKKPDAKECGDYRTISLIPHASKILLRILTRRMESKANDYIGNTQFGFRKGCGTREAIGMLRLTCERNIEHDINTYICFIDFEKAFDRINWPKLMDTLKKIGIDWRDRRLIQNLYMNQTATIRIDNEESEPAIIGQGVRQGCIMSPLLFSIYAERMMIEALEDTNEGIKIGGTQIKDIRFADDQAMTADSEEGLQKLIDNLNDTAGRYNMKINIKKTKVMCVSRTGDQLINVTLNGQQLEQVTKFKYLGSIITSDGRCSEEIRTRIAMAKNAFTKRKELLTKGLDIQTKKNIVKTIIWSIALYGSETWTLREKEIHNLEAFEMWIWRRMEKINWQDHITNEEVLQRIAEPRRLMAVIQGRKKKWIGHILRGKGIIATIIEGKLPNNRSKGRPRKGMLDGIIDGTYADMKEQARNRTQWRR